MREAISIKRFLVFAVVSILSSSSPIFCAAAETEVLFAQSFQEERKAAQDKFMRERIAAQNKFNEERAAARDKFLRERNAAQAKFLQRNWAEFRKIPGVSLPDSSPDSVKTIDIAPIKENDGPDIEIINALLREGISEENAAEIALSIIDNLGIDAIKDGQTVSIAGERNENERPVAVLYNIDTSARVILLQKETDGYKTLDDGIEDRRKEFHSPDGVSVNNPQFLSPLRIPLRVTSRFGMRHHPRLNRPQHHNGVDYGAPTGTPVYAIAAGTVIRSGFDSISGYYVVIKHANDIESSYAHLNEKGIARGRAVAAGEKIGVVGSTGRSTGPHLHLGIKKNGIWQDPEIVLGTRVGVLARVSAGKNKFAKFIGRIVGRRV